MGNLVRDFYLNVFIYRNHVNLLTYTDIILTILVVEL